MKNTTYKYAIETIKTIIPKGSDINMNLKKIFDENNFPSNCPRGIYYTCLVRKIAEAMIY